MLGGQPCSHRTSLPEAESVASRASAAGLSQSGVLRSDNHSSLHRGYWVAYSGVLDREGASGQARLGRQDSPERTRGS